jgi:hypothetical protein
VPFVTKYSLSAASLVLAIPAGFLAYLLVMTFLNKPGFTELAGFFQIIAGLTLAMVTLMVLMPLGILIFGQKPEKKEKPKEETDDGEDLAADEEDEGEDLGVEDEGEEMFAEDEEEGFEDDGFDDFEDDEFK